MFPWRATRDPYTILVSEVILQQTQAERVIPFFKAFRSRFSVANFFAYLVAEGFLEKKGERFNLA